jgi:hypothetical protein
MGPGMQLIFKSFVLSFSTLWRYLMVMPFVVVPGVLVVISLLVVPFLATGGAVLSIILIAPLLFGGLFTLLASFLVTAFLTYNIMIGCRAAFAALGRKNELDAARLVGVSMRFTLTQMVVFIFIFFAFGGIMAAILLMSGENPQLFATNPELVLLTAATNPIYLIGGLVMALLSLAVSALLATPMAGAAISATPKMGPTDPFQGLGTAFLPILAVLIITQVICTLTGAYAFLMLFWGQIATGTFQLLNGEAVTFLPWQDFAGVAGMTLLVIWASCWFYSAAALGWKGYSDDREAALSFQREEERFSPDELRRLRELRELNRLAPGH